jgi:hypothetical protein
MHWFRDNVRHGSWLALVAIAINLALSFGHIHAIGGRGTDSVIAAVLGASDHGKAPGHSDGPQGHDLCPICIASSTIANALAASPPAIPLQLDATAVDRTILPIRLAVALPRAAFQSRGPPVS